MATVEQQLTYSFRPESVRYADSASVRAGETAKPGVVGQVREPSIQQFISTATSCNKFVIARYVFFTLFMLLLLLCSQQASACCDGSTTGLEPEITYNDIKPTLNHSAVTVALAAEPETVTRDAKKDIKSEASAALEAVAETNFVKISDSGEALADNEASWDCVEDQQKKLIWEVKKNNGGIRDKDYTYSWLHTIDDKINGTGNGGRCKGGVNCDTSSYVRAMNEQKLCGYSDWRLPTRQEMETLVDYSTTPQHATINRTYFPEAVPSWYWTASENPQRENYAWYVLFRNGIALNDLKERPKHIRLVRDNRTQ